MEVLALSPEWDGPYDELYEYFDAPKFVDLTNEDSVHVDDCYWFCSRVGCDQKHGEESECEATENIFSAMTKCPNSAPPKSIRPPASRLATLPSSKAGMRLKGGVQGPEVVSSSLTPNKKVKSRVAKALIFQSPKKSVTPEASLELKTPMKYSKPKPTNPKPFRLRTAERSILKEARREKRVRSVTPTPKNDTTLQTGKCDREIVLEKRGFESPAAMAAMSGVGSLCAGDRTYRESNMSFSSSNYAARGVISCSVGRELGFRRASVCIRNPRFEVSALIRENDDKGSTTTSKSKSSSASALELLKTSSANRYTKERRSIIVIGISVHTSPVEMREKFTIPEVQWPQAIQELCALNHIEEAAVLSTCNRMEIYVVALSQSRGVKEVTEWMSKTSGVRVSELCEHRFLLYNGDAVQHLFEVSAGLDSLVLGEGQILAQVKQVVKSAEGVAGFDRKISGLFKRAIAEVVKHEVSEETKVAEHSAPVLHNTVVAEDDDKENELASDQNRSESGVKTKDPHSPGREVPGSEKPPKKTLKVTRSATTAKDNTAADVQVQKYSKPKPTNPKPFCLRTDERSILKEARREKRVRKPTVSFLISGETTPKVSSVKRSEEPSKVPNLKPPNNNVRKVDMLDGVSIVRSEKVKDEIVLDGNDGDIESYSHKSKSSLGLESRCSLGSSFGSVSSGAAAGGGRRSRRNSTESCGSFGVSRWKKKQLRVTDQKPFKLRTEQRGRKKEEELMRKIQKMEEQERMRIPIAQGLPWTTDEPECLVKPPVKECTQPIDLQLHSDVRAVERAEFDHQVKEKMSLQEQNRMVRERQRKLAEEEEIRRLRKELVPKTQPMPYFDRPFVPRRSEKHPTIPKEPKFHISEHKKIRCMSLTDFGTFTFH